VEYVLFTLLYQCVSGGRRSLERTAQSGSHFSTMGLCFQIHTCACLGMTYAPCTTTARSFAPTLNYSTPSRHTYRSQVHRKQLTSNFDQGASQLWVEITLKKEQTMFTTLNQVWNISSEFVGGLDTLVVPISLTCHLLLGSVVRNLKFLSCVAAGKWWVLHKSYLEKVQQKNAFPRCKRVT